MLLVVGVTAIGMTVALLTHTDAARAVATLILHSAAGGGC